MVEVIGWINYSSSIKKENTIKIIKIVKKITKHKKKKRKR